jgi:SAM-dependent methyltransferase
MNEMTRLYYEQIGWRLFDGELEDLKRWEDLRQSSRGYNSLGENRIYRHIPTTGEKILDVGCGPLLHDDLLKRTRRFKEYHCIDFSPDALDVAASKLGERGHCYEGDFLTLPFEESSFDCVISLSCLFHVHADLQEAFVKKLIHIAKPGASIIVSYANPKDWTSLAPGLQTILDAGLQLYNDYAYYFIHPIEWWTNFENRASVSLYPTRTLRSVDQRRLIPDGIVGSAILSALAVLEERFPDAFLKYGHYYTAVLKKR